MTDPVKPRESLMSQSDTRYQVVIGPLAAGRCRDYKTLAGAQRAALKMRKQGWKVTLWKGTLRRWGGWSWSSIDLPEKERP